MNLSECLLLSQTIILLLTCLVVLWYTIETYKIRKLTDIQSTLVSEQQLKSLETTTNNLSELSFIDLVFINTLSTASATSVEGKWTFVNKGGPVTDVVARATGDTHIVTIRPSKMIRMYGKVELEITNMPQSKEELFHVMFEIQYMNKLGFKAVQTYKYFPNFKHKFEFVKTYY